MIPHAVAPTLIIANADVRTMDPERPRAEAVVICQNLIAAVGTSVEMEALAGPRTRIIDAAGRLLLPGFNDAHVHFLAGGFSLTNVNLRDCRTGEEMERRLSGFVATLPTGAWVQGGDWDHENWPGATPPSRTLIDQAAPCHPVLLSRLDGHMAVANTRALRIAGISRNTPDPPGGSVVRDAASEPTGLLKDAAIDLVASRIPPMTREQKLAAARAATEHAATLGVTSVTDVSADDDVGIYHELLKLGSLKTRIYCARPITSWERLKGMGTGFGCPMLRIGALKGFCDGSLGATTALFFEPYSDAPETSGLLFEQMFPEGIMLKRVQEADRHGLQVLIHAIGDKANSLILDLFDMVACEQGPRDRRFRIEHAQHLRGSDVQRFGKLRVVASMQPYHAADDGRWCEKRIGKKRSQSSYVFRSLLDAGAMLAFGSDWTVAPLDPLLGIQAAVTRQTLDGKHPGGWVPAEKISIEEAVQAYTFGSAFAEFADGAKGTITPGKLADVILLSSNIFETDPGTIGKAHVVLTVVDGKVVYDLVD